MNVHTGHKEYVTKVDGSLSRWSTEEAARKQIDNFLRSDPNPPQNVQWEIEPVESRRVILTRLSEEDKWQVVANPKWASSTVGMSNILDNSANDYAEYKNCGCIYRMIRDKDWPEYGEGELADAWMLDPMEIWE